MLVVLALLLAAPAAPPGSPIAAAPAKAAPAPVALVPLRALGVPEDVVRALQQTLRNELSSLPEANIVSEAALAEALRREPDCDARLACACAAAAKAGARQLILGTASQLGDSFLIDLKLLDARTAVEVRRATHPVSGTQDALIETLREASVELLAPQRFTGALRVEVPGSPGATLFIDGKRVGAPLGGGAIEGLAPGQHTLRVADGRSREVSTFVEVRFGRTTEARIELGPPLLRTVPSAAMPGPSASAGRAPRAWVRPVVLTGAGLAVVAGVVGIVFHTQAYATAAELNRRESLNQLSTTDLSAYGAVDRQVKTARGLYLASAALAVATAGLFAWDLKF